MEASHLINLLIAIGGIIASGFSAYVGVRVAIAEIRGDIRRHSDAFDVMHKRLTEHGERIDRLEEPFFNRRRP